MDRGLTKALSWQADELREALNVISLEPESPVNEFTEVPLSELPLKAPLQYDLLPAFHRTE